MEKLKIKIIAILLIVILTTLIIPANVFATNENIQIVKTENEDYIIYVKNLANVEFKFAIAQNQSANDGDLSYIKSIVDGEGNQVAKIEKETYETIKDKTNYIYIKDRTETKTYAMDFSQAFDKAKMKEVETTTNRIATKLLADLEEKNEVVDGIQYKETVGGLKIIDDENADYEYVSVKLPAEKYSTLKELADKLNTEYETKDMYSKIEFAKEFNTLYEELINEATVQGTWKKVDNMVIRQPIDAQNGEQYVVLLKKVAKDGTEKYDAKFMTSYLDTEKPVEEEKVVKETAKLPITGDSIILFAVLAVIALALIVVFARIKKLQNKGKH